MSDDFLPVCDMPIDDVIRKLDEIGDTEMAEYCRSQNMLAGHEKVSILPKENLESFLHPERAWLNKQHQFGFIPPITAQSERYHPIVSAASIPPDLTLKNQQINIKLGFLRIHEYPSPLVSLGTNIHTILFAFEARNQLPSGPEPVAFGQTYECISGQDAPVSGYPIFIGLNVGNEGVAFSCKTVNIGNSNDEILVKMINSDESMRGLSLLTTAQPALAPFVVLIRGLTASLANRSKNVPVQQFSFGLDFDHGATGVRLAVGSYIVSQVPRPDEITWSDWRFDNEIGTIMRTHNLAQGEAPYPLPYNTVVFRVSKYSGD